MEEHDLINRINNNFHKMSKGQKRIAQYILENYDKAAFMTASKLGDRAGVSESTVVRFADALGYDGYPRLQKSLQELIRNKMTSLQRIEMTSEMDRSEALKAVMKSDMQNIRTTIEEVDEKAFNDAVEAILGARTVYVLGVRSSAALAQFMGYYLNFVIENVRVPSLGINDILEQMMRIDERDVCIGISFPRYSNRTIEGMHMAREKGATVIAITDSMLSPLAREANHLLIAKSDMASFVDSLVAPLSLINALIVDISLRKKEDITSFLDELEKLWDKTKVYSGREKK